MTVDRRAAAEVLAARTAELQAAMEVIASAGDRSPATVYRDPPAAALGGLDDAARRAVKAITDSYMTVQPLTVEDTRQRAAVIGAVALSAHHSGHQVWALPASQAAADATAANHPYSYSIADPAEAITAMRDKTRTLPIGSLVIVDDADHLSVDQLTALTVQASANNTKLLLVTDHSATPGPSREITDALAATLPWTQHLGAARTTDTVCARAATWLATQPATATIRTAEADLPGWLRNQLAASAEHRSAATVYSQLSTEVLAVLDEPGRRAVRRITASAMTTQSLHLGAATTGAAKAAILKAVTRSATASGTSALAIPIGRGTADLAAEQPYSRNVASPGEPARNLGDRTWKPPPGTLIILDGADHLDTRDLTWFLRYAQATDTKLLLVTDETSPGRSRELTDTLAAGCPWAAQHLGDPDTHQAATETARLLIDRHTELVDTYRKASQSLYDQGQSYSRERSREQYLSRDDGYDLSL